MQPPGELLDEGGVCVPARALDRLPVDVDAGHVVGLAPRGDRLGVPAPRVGRREDRRRDRRVERVPALVVVGERDEDAAVVVLDRGEEVRVEARRDHAPVGARLQPVDADLVDRPCPDGGIERGAVAEGPRADEIGAVRPSSSITLASAKATAIATSPTRTMSGRAERRRRGPAGTAAPGAVGVREP